MNQPNPPDPPAGWKALEGYIHAISEAIDCEDGDCAEREMAYQLALLLGGEAGVIVRPGAQEGSVELLRAATGAGKPEWTTDIDAPGARELLEQMRSNPEPATLRSGSLPESIGVGSLLALPVLRQGEASSVIGAAFREEDHATGGGSLRLGMEIARQTASLVEHVRLYAEMKQRSNGLEMIYQASLSLTSSLELEHVLNAILKSSYQLMRVALDTHIFLYDQDTLIFGAALRSNGITGVPVATPRKNGLTYTVARSGQAIVVENMKTHPLFKDAPPEWHGAIIGLPLKIGQRVVGVMTMALPEAHPINEANLRFLRLLGDQAAIAIENARLHRIINQQAHTDVVTGLPNRRSFEERLAEEVRRSYRYNHTFALVMLDMNDFKIINDTFGHPVGDDVLRQIGACLRKAIRDTDFLARYGGDEFAMIFPETDLDTAKRVAGLIHEKMAEFKPQLPGEAQVRPLTTGLGIAIYPVDARDEGGLVAAADAALYEDKRGNSSRG